MSLTVQMLRRYRNPVFIETGSKEGICATVAIDHVGFKEVHTIELDKDYYEKAKARCAAYPNIHLYFGDSAVILPQILEKVKEPFTVWIDAHPIVDFLSFATTPLLQEMQALKNAKLPKGFKILVDDLRCFSKEERKIVEDIGRSIGTVTFESNPPEVEPNDIMVIM